MKLTSTVAMLLGTAFISAHASSLNEMPFAGDHSLSMSTDQQIESTPISEAEAEAVAYFTSLAAHGTNGYTADEAGDEMIARFLLETAKFLRALGKNVEEVGPKLLKITQMNPENLESNDHKNVRNLLNVSGLFTGTLNSVDHVKAAVSAARHNNTLVAPEDSMPRSGSNDSFSSTSSKSSLSASRLLRPIPSISPSLAENLSNSSASPLPRKPLASGHMPSHQKQKSAFNVMRLKSDSIQSKRRIRDLNAELQAERARSKAAEKAREQSQQRIAALEAEKSQFEASTQDLKDAHEEGKRRYTEGLQGERKKLEDEVARLKAQLQAASEHKKPQGSPSTSGSFSNDPSMGAFGNN
jgi:hypothetical protein